MVKDRKQINKIAKSLFNTALKSDQVVNVGNSLKFMATILEKNPEILHFFSDIFQPPENHTKVLEEVARRGKFEPIVASYLMVLQGMRHMDWVPAMAEAYRRLADDHLGQERATVFTPIPLGKNERKTLIASLSELTGKKVFLKEQIDPSLIAGICVQIGSMIFDGSLSNQLQRIEKEIMNAS